MKVIVYNGGIAAGTVLCGVGAGLQWGLGIGLIVTGVLVLGLTLVSAHYATRSN